MAKVSPAKAGDITDAGWIPGSGRSPGEGHGNPLQCSCLENPMDRGAWWATVQGDTQSGTPRKQLALGPQPSARPPEGRRPAVHGPRAQAPHGLRPQAEGAPPGWPRSVGVVGEVGVVRGSRREDHLRLDPRDPPGSRPTRFLFQPCPSAEITHHHECNSFQVCSVGAPTEAASGLGDP